MPARRSAVGRRPVRARFPADYTVGEPDPDHRREVGDPESHRRWSLGVAEFDVARRFAAGQTYGSIALEVRTTDGRGPSPKQVRAFEKQLLADGILSPLTTGRRGLLAAGSDVLRVAGRRFARWDVVTFDPGPLLDRVPRRAASPVVAEVVLAGVAVAYTALGRRRGEFGADLPAALRGRGLLHLLAISALSSVVHESGHALACHRYGITVRGIGFGVRALALFAWTEPDEAAWAELPPRARVVTVVSGPLGSLGFGAAGALLWLTARPGSTARYTGVRAVLTGTFATIPTLLPVFVGDGYLLLTDLLELPNLRPQALTHARMTLLRDPRARQVPAATRVGYLTYAAGSAIGLVGVSGFVGWLVWTFARRPS